jgi:hypothetical protein
LAKALNIAGNTPLFEKFPRHATYLLTGVWRELDSRETLNSYIKNILDKSPEKIYGLLKSYSPFSASNLSSGPYYSDITKGYYEVIDKTFDVDYLYSIAKTLYKGDISAIQYTELDHLQTDENRLKQFMFYYSESKKDNKPTTTSEIIND